MNTHTHTSLARPVSQLDHGVNTGGNYPAPPISSVNKASGLLPEVCNLKQMTAGPSPDASGS